MSDFVTIMVCPREHVTERHGIQVLDRCPFQRCVHVEPCGARLLQAIGVKMPYRLTDDGVFSGGTWIPLWVGEHLAALRCAQPELEARLRGLALSLAA